MKETIQVEKEVYEAVLRNSVKVADLEAENQRLKKVERKKGALVNENYKLKKLLKECKPYVVRNVVFTTINKADEVNLKKMNY